MPRAPKVERSQDGQDVEMTAMHAGSDGECSESPPVEASSQVEDVSESTKPGTERASSPENKSLEILTDRFGDAADDRACCATGCDMEHEEPKKRVKRRVVDEAHGRIFNKLIEQAHVTGGYLSYLLERCRKHEERDENETSSENMCENRGT